MVGVVGAVVVVVVVGVVDAVGVGVVVVVGVVFVAVMLLRARARALAPTPPTPGAADVCMCPVRWPAMHLEDSYAYHVDIMTSGHCAYVGICGSPQSHIW